MLAVFLSMTDLLLISGIFLLFTEVSQLQPQLSLWFPLFLAVLIGVVSHLPLGSPPGLEFSIAIKAFSLPLCLSPSLPLLFSSLLPWEDFIILCSDKVHR